MVHVLSVSCCYTFSTQGISHNLQSKNVVLQPRFYHQIILLGLEDKRIKGCARLTYTRVFEMKKSVLFILLMALSATGFSQITAQKRPEIKKITTLYYGSSVDSSAYSSQFILRCSTTNRFDDLLVVPLGKSREDAITSLEALIQIYKSSSKETFDIGEGLRAYSNVSFETKKKELVIESNNCAGYAHLTIDGLVEALFGLPLWNGNDELCDQYNSLNNGEKNHKLKYKLNKGWLLDGNVCEVPHFISVALSREAGSGSSSNYKISDAVYNMILEFNEFYFKMTNN